MISRLLTLQRSAEIERVMRAYNGTNPDEKLLSEASLALMILRRCRGVGISGADLAADAKSPSSAAAVANSFTDQPGLGLRAGRTSC